MQVGAFSFTDIKPEELQVHADIASIHSDTDSIYTKSDSSHLYDFFNQIDTIAAEFQTVFSTFPSFIELSKLSTAATAYNNFTNYEKDELNKNDNAASKMDSDYESRLMNVFENIDILLTASNNFEYFDFYSHSQKIKSLALSNHF